jgi:hypothetical protein
LPVLEKIQTPVSFASDFDQLTLIDTIPILYTRPERNSMTQPYFIVYRAEERISIANTNPV